MFDDIQTNAIRSWMKLPVEKEVILMGNDPGTAETAKKLGLTHIPDVETTPKGIPMIGSLFGTAKEHAKYDVLCYVNADIILDGDFKTALEKIYETHKRFIASGQRINVDFRDRLQFNGDEKRLIDRLPDMFKKGTAIWGGPDYFLFTKDAFDAIPDYVIGRFFWDNWFFYFAHKNGIPMINLTDSITAVHQNHDYTFTVTRKYLWDALFTNPDSIRNFKFAPYVSVYNTTNFTHRLADGKLVPTPTSFVRRVKMFMRFLYIYAIYVAVAKTPKPLSNILYGILRFLGTGTVKASQ